jgi:hypothetical protein
MRQFFHKFKDLNSVIKLFLIAVFLMDVMIFLLVKLDYYVSFLKPTGEIIPILLTLIAFYVLARGIKIAKFWVVFVTILTIPVLGQLWFYHALMENAYTTVQSPTGREQLVIEHRDATLGETTHIYNFYQKTLFPGIMVKLNQDTVSIMTRHTNAGNLEVLGVADMEWVDGESVIFHSEYAKTEVALKYVDRKKQQESRNKRNSFSLLKTDVTQQGDRVEHTEVMDQFVQDAEHGVESEIRYVILGGDEKDPQAVYLLKSRNDTESDQSWVEIIRCLVGTVPNT